MAIVTGTRAEYGLLRSTIAAVRKHPKLRLQLVVTGMHLLRKFGHTIDQIQRDGVPIDARVRMQKGDDGPLDQAQGLGRGLSGIAAFCEHARTDIVVVLGDRIEAMAGALAAVTTGRILAHIHGGDVAAGDFDDSLRHAITKLAHVHFTATKSATGRVLGMGEEEHRVHCVGAVGLDRLVEIAAAHRGRTAKSKRALIIQHAYGRSADRERRTMNAVLKAAAAAGLTRTILYPNSDRGHTGILAAIRTHQDGSANGEVRVIRSLDRDDYLSELIESDVLVGNSSSGIIESATAGTPAVDVGARQRGREPSGRSVVHAEESLASIREAIARALKKRPKIGGPTIYGSGRAGARIADRLARVPLTDEFRRKAMSY